MISNYTIVSEAAGKIQANPWRYHESTEPYNLELLSEEERLEVAAAGKCAEDYAKVTFAFTQTVMKGSYPLPGYHALKRHAHVNGLIYRHHKKLFASIKKNIAAADIGKTVVADASGIPREHVTGTHFPGT